MSYTSQLFDLVGKLTDPVALRDEINALISDYDERKKHDISINETVLHFKLMEQLYNHAMQQMNTFTPVESAFQLGRLSYKLDLERAYIDRRVKTKDVSRMLYRSDDKLLEILGILYKRHTKYMKYRDILKISNIKTDELQNYLSTLMLNELITVSHKDSSSSYQITQLGIEAYDEFVIFQQSKGGLIYATRMVRRRNQRTDQKVSES